MDMIRIDIGALAKRFIAPGGKAIIGVDGFVDEVWQVVKTRTDKDDYTLYNNIRRFGELFTELGEGGISNEIVRKRRSFGGFTANTGNAVMNLGIETDMLGLFGTNAIDPVFAPLAQKARLISIGEPAVSHIFEFDDGKAMFPHIEALIDLDREFIIKNMSAEVVRALVFDADVIALGYWTNLREFDEMVFDICEYCLNGNKRQRMFFDFADLRKRDRGALDKTIKTLGRLNGRIPMTLSLNEHEAGLIFDHLGERLTMDIGQAAEATERIRLKTGIDEIVVHTPYFALSNSYGEGAAALQQRYSENPVRTTGAGDTFNGG
jgi:sugar/nucleoside kinase (ribokinase family)